MLPRPKRKKHLVQNGQPTNLSIPLSGMDLVLSDSYVNHVFVYETDVDVELLTASLKKALSVYPQFSGRVYKSDKGKPVLKCDDSGLPVTITHSKLKLTDLDPDNPVNPIYKKITTHTLPNATLDRKGPAAAIKITHLKNGGSILAFAHSHVIADAASAFDFFHAWSAIFNGHDIDPKPLDPKRIEFTALHQGLNKSKRSHLEPFALVGVAQGLKIIGRLKMADIRNETQCFRYSKEELSALKKVVTKQIQGSGTKQWVSTQDALTALIWKEIALSRSPGSQSKVNSVINFRARNDIPLSIEYFGNALAMRSVSNELWSTDNIRVASIKDLALSMRNLFSQVTRDSVSQDLAYLEGLLEQRKTQALVGLGLDIIEGGTTFNNWTCFKGYEISFGSDPIWYNPVLWPWSNFIHFVSTPNGSVIAQVQLPKDEMTIFSDRYKNKLYRHHIEESY